MMLPYLPNQSYRDFREHRVGSIQSHHVDLSRDDRRDFRGDETRDVILGFHELCGHRLIYPNSNCVHARDLCLVNTNLQIFTLYFPLPRINAFPSSTITCKLLLPTFVSPIGVMSTMLTSTVLTPV